MQRKQGLKHTCRKVHARFSFVLGIKQVKTIVKKVLTKEKQNCSLCARRRTKTRLPFCHLSLHFFTSSCSSSSVSWLSDTKVHLHEPLCAGEKLRPASTCPSFDSKYGDAASACIAKPSADSTRNGPWLTWDRLLSRDLPSKGETDVRKLVFTRKVTNNKTKNKHLQLDRIKVVMMRKRMRLPMKHFSFPN